MNKIAKVVKIEIIDSSDEDGSTNSNHRENHLKPSNHSFAKNNKDKEKQILRKRKLKRGYDDEDINPQKNHHKTPEKSKSDHMDNILSPSGRPKRLCTLKKKNSYADVDPLAVSLGEQDDGDEVYDPNKDPSVKVHGHVVSERQAVSQRKGFLMIDSHGKKNDDAVTKAKEKYKWIDYDEDTAKIRCNWCIKNNLKKWFINGSDRVSSLHESLKLHQASEEHSRSSKAFDTYSIRKTRDKNKLAVVLANSNSVNSTFHISSLDYNSKSTQPDADNYVRDVYCLPMECVDAIPIPDIIVRNLLKSSGLHGSVKFLPTLSPAKLREDISKAFSKTFNLRTQELLQFDYLALTEGGTKLRKPQKFLHFDGKTVLSFIGESHMYILLKQKSPSPEINWKELLFQEDTLRNLSDKEYREIMLSVMYRLSSNKHKKDATDEQKKLVDSLMENYQLNNYHQLVYVGNGFQQLVLFTQARRDEAFSTSHGDHLPLEKTFKRLFRKHYWNSIDKWCMEKIRECDVCLDKYGEDLLSTAKPLDVIMDDLIQSKKKTTSMTNRPQKISKSDKQKSMRVVTRKGHLLSGSDTEQLNSDARQIEKASSPTSPLTKKSCGKPDSRPSTQATKGVVVPLPLHTLPASNEPQVNPIAPVPVAPRPQPIATKQLTPHRQQPTASVVPFPMPSTVTRRSYTDNSPLSGWPSAVVPHKHINVQDVRAKPAASVIPQPTTTLATDLRIEPPILPSEKISPFVKREPGELLPPDDQMDSETGSERDEVLYEEDLEQAIHQNSKNTGDGSHCTNAMWSMYLLQQRGIYCDFFIMLLPSIYNGLKKPKIYGVHKVVFSAISGRIRKITKTTIKIGGKVTCEGLEGVIEFGYTGRLTGIHEIRLSNITQISSTALALDIKIDQYLQKHRPDFVKSSAKILVSKHPTDVSSTADESSSLGTNTLTSSSFVNTELL